MNSNDRSRMQDKPSEKPDEGAGDVEQQIWYHGFRPRRDVEALLPDPGDFLVRATDARTNNVELVLSLRSAEKGIVNLTIVFSDGKWQLGILKKQPKRECRFNTIPQLVEHYRTHKISSHMILKKPVARPDWLIKHEKVSYNTEKDLLGSGNFCHVYKGIYARSPKDAIAVAVKICHQGQDGKTAEEQREAREMMLQEARTMSFFVHQYVLQMYGVAMDHPPILIVLEFCPGGNLEKHLVEQKEKIETGERLMYVMEAARGMRYLHTKHCVHRDLAARNCLISGQGHIKIADFGLSKLLVENNKEDVNPDDPLPQIPVRWMAPETLKRPMKFSTCSDAWSFGVLMYEVFNEGIKPFPNDPPKKVATLIRNGNMPAMPEKTPSEAKEVVDKLWIMEPAKRIRLKDVCVKIWKILKKYPPPKPKAFTLNKIPGVTRSVAIRETSVQDDPDDHTDTNRDSVDNDGRSGEEH